MTRLTVAIDGPGSSGKGTLARAVAQALGYQYVDTGAMYRTVALVSRERGISLEAAEALGALTASLDFEFKWNGDVLLVFVDGRDVTTAIREDAISMGASTVSRHPPVRDALLDQQRAMADRGGVVMDGRDIGTVVLPQADVKVYLDADLDERARRRHDELIRRGSPSSLDAVREALEARDKQDMNRAVAPLRAAEDAVVVDSTNLTPRQMTDAVLALIRDRLDAVAR